MSEQFTKIDNGLLVRAPAKINLSLLVAGKREDGYHDIETIMAKIDWFDEVVIEKQNIEHSTLNAEHRTEEGMQKAEEKRQNIELICKGPYKVPEGEENLVYKAAKAILDFGLRIADFAERRTKESYNSAGRMPATQPVPRLKITLTKNIPAGSGLGSGSSDAAATLLGINRLCKLDLGKKELAGLAAQLGSDAAFFLDGPMALCTARGEKVKKLLPCEFRVLLIVPDVSVSTKRVYENYRHDENKYGRLREEIKLYIEKKRVDLICGLCANMLQESCFVLHPELGVLKKRIESLGVRPVCLSGSGSSMFCFINDRNEEGVRKYREKLESDFGCKSIIVNNNSW